MLIKFRADWLNTLWQYKFKLRHPQLFAYEGEPDKLRLVLGVGRSGTSWTSKVLSKTPTPLRFLDEFLHQYTPKLPFSNSYDHTAISYQALLADTHPLLRAYRSMTYPNIEWDSLIWAKWDQRLLRDDENFSFCLIKEVHSLLATKALMKSFACPTLLILRNPLYTVDSLLNAQGLNTPYLVEESRSVLHPEFLEQFIPDQVTSIRTEWKRCFSHCTNRQEIIIQRLIAIALIQVMFQVIADEFNDNVMLVRYEDLCQSPKELFPKVAAFLSLAWDESVGCFLDSTVSERNEHADPYSIYRETSENWNRPFRFLSNEDIDLCVRLLSECGLGDGV